MVGHVTHDEVHLWLQVDRPGTVRAVVDDPDGSNEAGVASLTPATEHTGVVVVDDLDPDVEYTVTFELDGEPVEIGGVVRFRTFPRPGDPTRLRIALVSCARVLWDSTQAIWGAVAADEPDVVVWLGDNNYFEENEDSDLPPDWTDPDRMRFKYAELRGLPTLQPVLRSAANYAIWDDHDYADGEPDRTWASKDTVAAIFERFWANPSYGDPARLDGVYSSFVAGDVEVFLLDDRYWRDPEDAPDGSSKTMLGREQIEWLQRGLERSRARLKIVAVGVQVLADYHRYDGFLHYSWERKRLLDWIRSRRIEGVVFVSGDRHLSELMRWDRSAAYPLYELTASPVANRVFTTGLQQPNPIRIGGYAGGFNYGLLDIDTTRRPGALVFRLKDDTGAEVLRHDVGLDELELPRRSRRSD